MKLVESHPSIANLRDMLKRGELTANKEYQRSPGLWPNASRSYFIDTILEGYPFPKVYFHEFLEKKTKKVKTEIVDGQQRISTIFDFLNDQFALGKNSTHFNGLRFSQLDEEIQDRFLFYTVSTDVIRDAGRTEILQMFRRMNAFTLPLNSAEKRHSEFFGEFKDMVTQVLDKSSLLYEWSVFTTRQTVRMSDAAFIADLVLAMEEGVVSTSDAKLHNLYKKYDDEFPKSDEYIDRFNEIFSCISHDLSEIRESFMIKPYAMHALFCALFHNKYGLPGFEAKTSIAPVGSLLTTTSEKATSLLLELAAAHEAKDESRYPKYVSAMSEGANRERQRTDRIFALCLALRGKSA